MGEGNGHPQRICRTRMLEGAVETIEVTYGYSLPLAASTLSSSHVTLQ
jgi:hypothetical protein